MTIKKKEERHGKIEIDLTGPNGNAFYLLGMANRYGRQLELDVGAIQEEMKAGDYENLVEVFDKHFGEVIDLLR